jgi:hypothetical protein
LRAYGVSDEVAIFDLEMRGFGEGLVTMIFTIERWMPI